MAKTKIITPLDVANHVYTAVQKNYPVERIGEKLPVHDVFGFTIITTPEKVYVFEAVELVDNTDHPVLLYKVGRLVRPVDPRNNPNDAMLMLAQQKWLKQERAKGQEWVNIGL